MPGLASLVLEPVIGVLGDMGRRRALVLSGGLGFAAALVLAAVAPGFGLLLGAFLLMFPSSGAFVSLSQATLMDLAPAMRERNMRAGRSPGPSALPRARSCSWRRGPGAGRSSASRSSHSR